MPRNEVVLRCGLHSRATRAVEAVTFALDGEVMEVDLCGAHAARLRDTITSWSASARPTGPLAGGGRGIPKRKVSQPRRSDGPRQAKRIPVRPAGRARLEAMLAAAEEVFAEVGYEATSTNLVAERSGTSVGSVYNFLGSKEAIAIALLDRYLAELAPLYEEAVRGRAAVPGLVDVVDAFLEGHPALEPLLRHRFGGRDLRTARQRLRTSLADPTDRLLARQRRFADPARRWAAAELCADMIWGMVLEAGDVHRLSRGARLAELKQLLAGYAGSAVVAA